MTRHDLKYPGPKRWCWYIVEQDPTVHGGYVPSMVEADVPGHALLAGRGEGSLPWIWGQTIEEAWKVCTRMNQERLGIDQAAAEDIAMSSMAAQNRRNAK